MKAMKAKLESGEIIDMIFHKNTYIQVDDSGPERMISVWDEEGFWIQGREIKDDIELIMTKEKYPEYWL